MIKLKNNTLKEKFRISARPCNILYIIKKHQFNPLAPRDFAEKPVLNSVQVSRQSYPGQSKLMMSQVVERTWRICTGGYRWLRGPGGRGGGILGISGWGCAPGTLEPLTYIRASSAEFCYPILE